MSRLQRRQEKKTFPSFLHRQEAGKDDPTPLQKQRTMEIMTKISERSHPYPFNRIGQRRGQRTRLCPSLHGRDRDNIEEFSALLAQVKEAEEAGHLKSFPGLGVTDRGSGKT